MAGLAKYTPNRAGMRALLKSEEVRVHLFERAERMAVAAQAIFDARQLAHSGEVEVVADSEIAEGRARAAVIAKHPAAIAIEKKHHVLAEALDAAKG